MGGIVSCGDPAGSITSGSSRTTDSTDEEISTHSKNVQFHRPPYLCMSEQTPFYQVLLLGFQGTGKTSLMTRNAKQMFHRNCVPSVVTEKSINSQIVINQDRRNVLVRFQLTDIPGAYLEKACYSRSLCDLIKVHDGIIIAVDCTRSFCDVRQDLEKHFNMVNSVIQEQSDVNKECTKKQGSMKCIIITLTKVDLLSKAQVTIEQVQSIVCSSNLKWNWQNEIRLMETSALYGINTFVLFQNIAQMCHNWRTVGESHLYDFWKQPIIAEAVVESWGIKPEIHENEAPKRSNQQKKDNIILPQQVHATQKCNEPYYWHDESHQAERKVTFSSPVTVIDSPRWTEPSKEQASNMGCLTIGHALLDSCPVEDMPMTRINKKTVDNPGLNLSPPKPVLTLVSNSSEEVVKYSPSVNSPLSEEERANYGWSGITEHRRSISSVVSMIEDKDSAPESCKEMERRLSSYKEKMMEAKEKNDFAVANMYKQEVIKCQLLLSETRNRRDKVTKLLNRNAFDEDIAVFERICESKTPGLKGVIFAIDLMNFKLLNDEHGHVNGDRALRRFGRALKGLVKKMAKASGKAWNVYRVGGDEFAITALVRSSDRELFRRAAQNLADIQISWEDLVVDCKSTGAIFARIGGVFGKYAKYEDADIIERNIKERNKFNRKTLMQPEKIERVLLYYLDVDDRNWVIAQCEREIQAAVRLREFSRCSEIQEYIKFLREGFLALKKENHSDGKHDSSLSRIDTAMLLGDSTLYNTKVIQRLKKRGSPEELHNIEESDGSESSVQPFVSPKIQEGYLPLPNCGFKETNRNICEIEGQINRPEKAVIDFELDDLPDNPPPYQSDSEKEGTFMNKSQPTPIGARQSISDDIDVVQTSALSNAALFTRSGSASASAPHTSKLPEVRRTSVKHSKII